MLPVCEKVQLQLVCWALWLSLGCISPPLGERRCMPAGLQPPLIHWAVHPGARGSCTTMHNLLSAGAVLGGCLRSECGTMYWEEVGQPGLGDTNFNLEGLCVLLFEPPHCIDEQEFPFCVSDAAAWVWEKSLPPPTLHGCSSPPSLCDPAACQWTLLPGPALWARHPGALALPRLDRPDVLCPHGFSVAYSGKTCLNVQPGCFLQTSEFQVVKLCLLTSLPQSTWEKAQISNSKEVCWSKCKISVMLEVRVSSLVVPTGNGFL